MASSTPSPSPNSKNQHLGKHVTTPVSSRKRSREIDLCFTCRNKGHWSVDCPTKSKRKINFNQSPNGVASSHPICRCKAGNCRVFVDEDGLKYFVCPVKRGQGACNFKQRYDLPETNRKDDETMRHVQFSDVGHSEKRELWRKLPLPGPSEDVISSRGDSGVHFGLQSSSTDCEEVEATRAVKPSIAKALFHCSEQRELKDISLSSVPSEGEIPGSESPVAHFLVHAGSVECEEDEAARVVQVSNAGALSQYSEQRELKDTSLSSKPSEGGIPDREASGGVQLGLLAVSDTARNTSRSPRTSGGVIPSREGHFVVQSGSVVSETARNTSCSPRPSGGVIPGREACGTGSLDLRAFNSFEEGEEAVTEVQASDTGGCSQYKEQKELRDTLGLSNGENPDREASRGPFGVHLGSSDGNSSAGPAMSPTVRGDDYVDDILLSAARHFTNCFLKRISVLSVQSLLGHRDQLVAAIKRASNFGVDCSAFVSQIEKLIHQIDEFNEFSGGSAAGSLADQGATIQQFKDKLNLIDSEDACRRERLEAIQGELQNVSQAEDVLIAKQIKILQALDTITEDARKLASERQHLSAEMTVAEAEEAQSQQMRAELQGQIEQAKRDYAENFALRQAQLSEQLTTSLMHLLLWR